MLACGKAGWLWAEPVSCSECCSSARIPIFQVCTVLPESATVRCQPPNCAQGTAPRFLHGATQAQPVLPVAGEVFQLRKLLPQTADYDFNVHVLDFLPGEYLNVKEVHYNQHGLLLLQGKGFYRCVRGEPGCLGGKRA